MSVTRSSCTAHGPKADLQSAKKKTKPQKRRKARNPRKARRKKASGTSKSLLSITSRTAAPPELLRRASTTRKGAAPASPALRQSSSDQKFDPVAQALLPVPLFSRRTQREQRCRIQVLAAPAHREVKMRRRGAARSAAQRDELPRGHLLALFDLELREMHVDRYQALTVIQHHAVSFEIERPRKNHCPGIGRVHRRAGGHAEIEPLVLSFLYPVHNARSAEDARSLCLCRPLKRTGPERIRISRGECLLLCRLCGSNLGLHFFRRFHKSWRQRDFAERIMRRPHPDVESQVNIGIVSSSPGNLQRVNAWLGLQTHTRERVPTIAFLVMTEFDLLPEKRSCAFFQMLGTQAKEHGRA